MTDYTKAAEELLDALREAANQLDLWGGRHQEAGHTGATNDPAKCRAWSGQYASMAKWLRARADRIEEGGE